MFKKMWLWARASAVLLLACSCMQNPQSVEATESSFKIPEGVYIDLTRDFYEALQQGEAAAVRSYSNDPKHEYLRRIAVASEFTVKTNLTIIRQQEKIIDLLERLHNRGRQGS